MAAKIELSKKKYNSPTRCLEELHWIPIQYRIEVTLVFKCLQTKCLVISEKLLMEKEIRKQGLRSTNNARQPKYLGQTERHLEQGPSA